MENSYHFPNLRVFSKFQFVFIVMYRSSKEQEGEKNIKSFYSFAKNRSFVPLRLRIDNNKLFFFLFLIKNKPHTSFRIKKIQNKLLSTKMYICPLKI